MGKKVLIIGSGGREHAITWKLSQSPRVSGLYVAPGNGGTQQIAENIPIEATDIDGLVSFVKAKKIDLTIVGPDDPLAFGIVDKFQSNDLRIFGPTQAAAQIESSKVFSKQLMSEARIPTADFKVFSSYEKALVHVSKVGAPIVIKASGLALGKGVYVCETIQDAKHALKLIMLDRVHKSAGDEAVVEEFLEGQEISVHAFCDGKTFVLFPTAQDHKPVGDGDTGMNTGGMGTISPVPWVNNKTAQDLGQQFVQPTLEALARQGKSLQGILYPGIKMTELGPKALEFNARLGDPETQSYMRLLETDLFEIIEACVDGNLANADIKWNSGFAACVVVTSGGYPSKYKTNMPITGLDVAEEVPGVVVFHAGTKLKGQLVTSGGRVLGVSAIGGTLQQAVDRAYKAVRLINFEGMYYRRDIGAKSLS